MKLKQFLDKLNFNSDCVIEVCDTEVSLDCRTRLTWADIHKNDFLGLGSRKVNSFTVANGRLTVYVA